MQMFGQTETRTVEDDAALSRIHVLAPAVNGALSRIKQRAEHGHMDRCEESARSLKEAIRNAKLPKDYTEEANAAIDALMLQAFMKATSVAAKAAIEAGREDEIERRAMKIREARAQLAGAIRYKAPKEFQRKCERMLETALYSGGVRAKGPTRAKPDYSALELQAAV
jgi:predicted component of type VI protein secretion system